MGVNGFVFYEGPSLINQEPIVGIVTLFTRNRATGQMAQTWILPADLQPSIAVRDHLDESVCGRCYHRGSIRHQRPRTCYVSTIHGPDAVWKAYQRGIYPRRRLVDIIRGGWVRDLRLGAYGEPPAIPFHHWDGIERVRTRTGYTHVWREDIARPFQYYIMASVESEEELDIARSMGWRCFYARKHDEESPIPFAIQCPKSLGLTTCVECGLCNGWRRSTPDIWHPAHGSAAKHVGRNT